MMKENVLQSKSYDFALRIIKTFHIPVMMI